MSRYLLLLLLLPFFCFGQETAPSNAYFDVQLYSGTMIRHNKNVAHLVRDHPAGFVASYNVKTKGGKYWHAAYNYPDWGVSFLYQDFKTEVLGKNLGLYGHYNFYFFNRRLQLRLAEGIAYNTNPFDIDDNFKNVAYGSHLVGSTYILLNYYQPNLFEGVGMQLGLSFVHHSNASFKAPNSGSNVVGVNIGVQYDSSPTKMEERQVKADTIDFSEKIKYNIVFRGGVNEGDIIGLGQQPFGVLSIYADKRLGYKSSLQFGTELFVSEFLKKEIEYRALSFPSSNLTGDEDYKRVGLFVGHELRLGKLALPTQLGYYLYWPYEYEPRVYSRIGVKYYISDAVFGVVSLKTHAANAENVEFGIGIRL
ncbi:MAG: acyloxyacyl hydrolase [Bacteroidetes bacterium]|nr:acyloxyacyl hydrolase [Bacteroidota bacterium]